jgi:hypothetical protein
VTGGHRRHNADRSRAVIKVEYPFSGAVLRKCGRFHPIFRQGFFKRARNFRGQLLEPDLARRQSQRTDTLDGFRKGLPLANPHHRTQTKGGRVGSGKGRRESLRYAGARGSAEKHTTIESN